MSAPQLRVIKESKGVSTHWDPNTPWAREPRLRSVVELGRPRPRRRNRRVAEAALRYLLFAVGVMLGAWLRG